MFKMDLDTWRPTVLCLGSGGVKGLNEMGGVYWFWSNGNLEKIDTYIGSSVGAIINAFLCVGWTPPKMLEYALETTLFRDFRDFKWTQAFSEFGLIPNSSFDDALAERLALMITMKIGMFSGALGMPTMKELYDATGKRLIIVVVSLKDEEEVYIDYKSHPDLNLLVALRMSSNTPIIFGKLEHQNDYYVDGAIMVPLPINYLDDGNTDILAIAVQDKKAFAFREMNAFGYYDRIMALPLNVMADYAIANSSDKCVCIVIPVTDDMSMLDMGSNIEARMQMFISGYEYVEMFMSNYIPSHKQDEPHTKPPLTKELLKACANTQAAQILLRAMREEPEMLKECLGEQVVSPTSHPQYDNRRSHDDDIIEIVRDIPQNFVPRQRRSPMQGPHASFLDDVMNDIPQFFGFTSDFMNISVELNHDFVQSMLAGILNNIGRSIMGMDKKRIQKR